MNAISALPRQDAQQRADAIRIFRQELQRLQQENVLAGELALSAAQQQAITQHQQQLLDRLAQQFDIDRNEHSSQLSLPMRAISFLGALALAASVFYLFLQFWGLLETPVQVLVLMGASLCSFSLTIWLGSRAGMAYFTKLAALVAFACFALNLTMLGTIFNLGASPHVLLPLAAMAFFLAYDNKLKLLLAAGILSSAAYIGACTGSWGGMVWLSFGEYPENFLLPGLLAFFLPQRLSQQRYAGFASVYRVFGLLMVLLPIMVLSHHGSASYL
ncbi:MAG: DUF2157 domain-containing protein, partial [Janthinobacterium lividum]